MIQTRALIGCIAFVVVALIAPSAAEAHAESGQALGFVTGFLHPLSGLDHIAAMVAVGLWGAQLGVPALWVLPVTFPLVMAFGGFLALIGMPLPGAEIGIAASDLVLGLMVMTAARPPLWVAAVLVGIFAIFHGHAHGSELGPDADAVLFSVGFVVATGLLHLCGISIGMLQRWRVGQVALRLAGAGIAAAGPVFLWLALS